MKIGILFHSLDRFAGGVDNRLSDLEISFPENLQREFLLFKKSVSLPHKGDITFVQSLKIPSWILKNKLTLKPFAIFFGFLNLFIRIYSTRRLIEQKKFDKILAIDDYFVLIAILATFRKNICIIASVRNNWDDMYNGTLIHLLPDFMYKRVLPFLMRKYVKHVHTVSKCLSNELKKNYNIKQCIYIYNLFDIKKIQLKAKDQIEIKEPFLINIGHFNRQKNQKDLLKTYYILKKEFEIKHKLLLIGDGSLKKDIIKEVEFYNLTDEVIFLNQKDNPYKYLKRASLYLSTSLFEGLPAVFIESIILEVPIVTYNFKCGANELAIHLTDKNPKSLAIKANEVLQDISLQKSSILFGKKIIEQELQKEKIINKWMELFKC
ncbi:glycosyltransferase [Hydrogenimonas thermophila]|uniref:Glycosyltransferase involved in cell wall bisynthesis n=1 Tax=Hydrogenimonas thermophila TaxID=223786 RepID=A0A1I5L2Y3_9BACT|nr:glycosyltransferase [Hydrogenimonas thermophila]WOE70031.1 glycosyltransferase [Hydrogenimonas thermophila]WOE72548.1 glycosyltransferase [Hydrogenimonas thermophila]SFO91710.1 Glycosyltransferase involved in cell wall bisynthesis [Hydrogenimonas thermophila]